MFLTKPVLLVDTREQTPLDFSPYKEKVAHVIRMKLNQGDYSIYGWEERIAWERKSLADLVGTLTQGRERFFAELERLAQYEYASIIIESPFGSVDSPYGFSKMNHKTIIGMLQAIQVRYNIDVIFSGSRSNSAEIIIQRMEALIGKA